MVLSCMFFRKRRGCGSLTGCFVFFAYRMISYKCLKRVIFCLRVLRLFYIWDKQRAVLLYRRGNSEGWLVMSSVEVRRILAETVYNWGYTGMNKMVKVLNIIFW